MDLRPPVKIVENAINTVPKITHEHLQRSASCFDLSRLAQMKDLLFKFVSSRDAEASKDALWKVHSYETHAAATMALEFVY